MLLLTLQLTRSRGRLSLRVNLDMGKTVYAHAIQNDPEIPGTIVRTSTLPEELGRIEYLLSDKVRRLATALIARTRLILARVASQRPAL